MNKTSISILAGLGGMFGWGVSDFFANNAADKIGHTKTVFWSQVFGLLFLAVLSIFFPLKLNLSTYMLGVFTLASLCYSLGYIYLYKAFEIGNISVASTTSNLNVIIGMLIAFVWKGQRLVGLQPIAVILVLLGIFLVSINFKDLINSKVSLLAGVKEALICAFAFGFFWNFSEFLSEQTNWLTTALVVKVFSLIILFLVSIFTKDKLNLSKSKFNLLPIIGLVGILEAFAVASVNFGLQIGDLVLVDPIAAALSVVTITLAVIFLKEKLSRTQTIGIISTIAGIIMTAI